MEAFGQMLRRLRRERGLSLRRFAEIAGIDFGYIGQIERGERRCSPEWAGICDQTLAAEGTLLEAYRLAGRREDDVRRRAMLGAVASLGPMIAFEALRPDSLPALGVEALRHDLNAALRGTSADLGEWEEIAWNYSCSYAETPARVMLEDVRVDLLVARMQLADLRDDAARATLQKVIAQLSVFMAQTFGNLGDFRTSCRWWRTAREFADASADGDARMWVRGREIIRGLYERRPLPVLIGLADQARAITQKPGVGTGAVLAGRAQALAMAGRTQDARAAMDDIYHVLDRLPERVAMDTVSMHGWPEHRLRHTESFVYTHLGQDARANVAYDRALTLYPDHMFRERAQVELHRAMRLVHTGDAKAGASHAVQVIDALPGDQRIEVVLEVARSVANSVPAAEQRQPQVTELREKLSMPPAPSR